MHGTDGRLSHSEWLSEEEFRRSLSDVAKETILMRFARPLALAGSLLVTTAALCGATTKPKAPIKKADAGMITCPIMHSKVAKSKAIKVVAANGFEWLGERIDEVLAMTKAAA
jgi:hypothetical protein